MSALPENSHKPTNWRLSRDLKRRQRLLDLIDRVWSLPGHEDMRLGQLLSVVTHAQQGERGIEHNVWNYEDAELELRLVAYLDSQQSPLRQWLEEKWQQIATANGGQDEDNWYIIHDTFFDNEQVALIHQHKYSCADGAQRLNNDEQRFFEWAGTQTQTTAQMLEEIERERFSP